MFSAAKTAGRHALPGEAEGVGHATLHLTAGEHRGARGGVDDAAPGMAEAHVAQRRECLVELLGEALEARRSLRQRFIAASTEVVDGVVAGPEYAVVGGLAQVMELVARIGDAVAAGPADSLQLLIAQRLADQAVVIYRDHAGGQVPEQRRAILVARAICPASIPPFAVRKRRRSPVF
jgi:hypothetical protein